MLIEKELENKIVSALKARASFTGYVFTTSRTPSPETEECDGVIAVSTGFRVNDQFSLSPMSINCTIAVATRVEQDVTSEKHENAVEAIADSLSYWHKFPSTVTAFDCQKFKCGELRMDGGSGRSYDSSRGIWTEAISFTLRGSEIFNN